jgi:hypothetical protein
MADESYFGHLPLLKKRIFNRFYSFLSAMADMLEMPKRQLRRLVTLV